MYCENCGCKLPDDSRFCSQCGCATDAAPVKKKIPTLKPFVGKRIGILKIVLIVFFAVAVMVGCYMLFRIHRNIAEIPDPESVYGVTISKEESDDLNKTYFYTIRTEENHSQETAYYIECLNAASGIIYNEYWSNKSSAAIYQYKDIPHQRHALGYAVTVSELGQVDGYYETRINIFNVNNCKLVSVSEAPKSGDSGTSEENIPQKTENVSSSGSDGGGSSVTPSPVEPLQKVETNCTGCFGSGEESCSNCGGVGYKMEYQSVPNYSGSSSGSSWSSVKVNCYRCRGSGSVTCSRCGGSGKQ